MRKKVSKEKVSFRDLGKKLHLSPSSVWDIMDKIRFRFERNKHLMYFMEEKSWDIEKILLELR